MKLSPSLVASLVFAAVALGALAAVPSRPALPPAPVLVPRVAPPADPVASPLADGPDPAVLHELARSLTWARDPFAGPPPVAEPSPVEEPVAPELERPAEPSLDVELSGISRMDGRHLAIVDHELVHVGSVLPSGHVVARITATTVTLRRGEEELTFTLADAGEDHR